MKTYITLFIVLIVNTSFGQITNVKAGLWSNPSVWSNNIVPSDTTNVVLSFDITIDINSTCNFLNTNGHNVIVNSGIAFDVKGNSNIVQDVDGKVYNTVTIGNQVWMKENLNVSHYRNGDTIPEIRDSSQWASLTTGAWCYYRNNADTGLVYGKLYNWYAVNDPRGLAPIGWHIPSDSEWTVLTTYLSPAEQFICTGYDTVSCNTSAGGKMKENGTSHWFYPNGEATNSSGFNGLPAGYIWENNRFLAKNQTALWWSSNNRYSYLQEEVEAYSRVLYIDDGYISGTLWSLVSGFSVRCVKD